MPEHGLPSLSSCPRGQDTGPGRSPSVCRTLAVLSSRFRPKKQKGRAAGTPGRIQIRPHPYGGMIRIRFLGRSRTSSQRLCAPHWIFSRKSVPVFSGTFLLSTPCPSLSIPILGQGSKDQYMRSSRSTMSPMTPSSQWHSSLAPQSFTSWAQLAGAKGMAERAIMGMSFWLSPTQ